MYFLETFYLSHGPVYHPSN